jgi:Ca2+-binding RTX toxin-like protein
VALAAIACVPSAAQAADGWSPAASMSTARSGHTATVLANGKVLVTGGANGSGLVVASAELYDPVGGTWSPAASMSGVRDGHTATLLKSGKVLVTGGNTNETFDEPLTASAELYDPARNMWSAAASMGEVRSSHTATLLGNGKVLVTGGSGSLDINFGHGFPSSAELYDPVSDTWSPTAGLSMGRAGLTATLLTSGKVLVTGGFDDRGGDPASAELYDPARGSWSPAASMSTPRSGHTATLLASGKVLVTGGHLTAAAELYDPARDTWSRAPSMRTPRDLHTATLLTSGKVLVTGGFADDTRSSVIASSELFDPVSRTWSAAASMSTPRAGHRATFLATGKVLVTGGDTGSGVTASAELFGMTVPGAPRAVGDAYATQLGATLVVRAPGVLRNDSDPNGDVLRAVLVSGPAHGRLTLNPDGSLRYTPAEDFFGVDSFRYQASDGTRQSAAATVRLTVRAVCGGVAATKVGTSAANTLTGTAAADVIIGLGGNDTIRGLGGNDRVCGGSGADLITGGSGNDIVIGGSGNDVLRGEAGHDRLFGGAGADILFGGDGDDLLDGGANAPDSCQGGPGSDTVTDSCERVS